MGGDTQHTKMPIADDFFDFQHKSLLIENGKQHTFEMYRSTWI